MRKLLFLVAIVPVLALAACGGGGGGNDSATAAGGSAGTVAVENLGDAGRVLVDSSGQALYASDQEASGKVLCTGACESFWTPLTIKGGQPSGSVPGMLGVVNRPDGSRQVTYNGMPVYSFTQDSSGEVTGDGFRDAFDGRQFHWNVVSVAGGGGSSGGSTGGSSGGSTGGSARAPSYGY